MNVPVIPPLDLAPLAQVDNVAQIRVIKAKKEAKRDVPIASLVAAAGVLAWRLAPVVQERRRRSSRNLWIAGGLSAAAVAVGAWQLQRLFAREPEHEVEMRRGRLEIRRYPSLRIAETTVDRGWEDSLNEGFRRLAGFLFGRNESHRKLAMSTPVLGTGDGAGFKVAFVLPEDEPVPAPEDTRIAVQDVPARRVAVLRFTGRHDAQTIEARKQELARALVLSGLKPRGEAYFAAYDPPSTIPLLRRNELWVELEEV